jgi:hypothetical protein
MENFKIENFKIWKVINCFNEYYINEFPIAFRKEFKDSTRIRFKGETFYWISLKELEKRGYKKKVLVRDRTPLENELWSQELKTYLKTFQTEVQGMMEDFGYQFQK